MAYVPEFEHDVFISYAWVNNQPPPDHMDDPNSGWVTQFRKALQRGLDEKLGRLNSSSFFFDQAGISKDRDFNPQIEAKLSSSATLVAFFSPGYLASDACRQEMLRFNELAGDARTSGRVFLVRLDEVPLEEWPDDFQRILHNVLGYTFYRTDETRGITLKLRPGEDGFTNEFEMLRKSIADQLKRMKRETQPAAAGEPAERPTVLLARSTPDLRSACNALRCHCESAGLRVLPERNYPSSPEKFREEFEADLRQADVFVQLLSDCYSDRTEEFPLGHETYQLDRARTCQCTVMQWRDDSLDLSGIDDETHRNLISSPQVRYDLPNVFYQAVVETAQHDFAMGADVQVPGRSDQRSALIRVDTADNDRAARLVQQLSGANIGCRIARNGVQMVDRLRKDSFDALVIVMGNCAPDWLEVQGDELIAVHQNLKEQAPLRAFCHLDERRHLPPWVGPRTHEFVTPDDVDRLIRLIHGGSETGQ